MITMHQTIRLPSIKLKRAVEDYFEKNQIPLGPALKVDVALALVRMNTAESRAAAEKLLGKKITVCPPAVPPWPPKPVAVKREPRVSIVRQRVYDRSGDPSGRWNMPKKTEKRFRMIRKGMTRAQILTKGVPARDISRWTRSGNIVWSTP